MGVRRGVDSTGDVGSVRTQVDRQTCVSSFPDGHQLKGGPGRGGVRKVVARETTLPTPPLDWYPLRESFSFIPHGRVVVCCELGCGETQTFTGRFPNPTFSEREVVDR